MNQQIITQLIEIILLAIVSMGLLLVVMASVYDMRTVRQRYILSSFVRKLRCPRQPHVTVLIYAKNNAGSIEACLKSVIHSRYYEYDIVVVDNVSSDNTKRLVRDFISKHPHVAIYLYAKVKPSDRLSSLGHGYARSQKGAMVLALTADSIVAPTLIKNLAARLMISPEIKAVSMAELSPGVESLAATLAHVRKLTHNIYSKGLAQLNVGRLQVGNLNVMYRKDVLVHARHGQKVKHTYGGSVIKPEASQAMGAMNYILSFAAVITTTYCMYAAATLQSSELLVVSWLICVVWLLLVIWADDATIRQKLRLSFFVPSMYFLLYAQQIVVLVTNLARTIPLTIRR